MLFKKVDCFSQRGITFENVCDTNIDVKVKCCKIEGVNNGWEKAEKPTDSQDGSGIPFFLLPYWLNTENKKKKRYNEQFEGKQ